MTGKDDDSFAGFVQGWNAMVELKTPAHHAEMAGWLEEHVAGPNRRMLLMAFRGSGKSTLVGLFAAWLLLRDPNRRLLVLAADLKLAMKMVRNVKRILERHPGCSHLKPPTRERDQWAADRFTVVRPMELRDPSMAAAGIGGNITGSRADVVICDDVEVPRNADTAVKRAALRERLSELEYVLVPGGVQLYVGTPHAQDSLYAEETDDGSPPFLDGFERKVLPVYTEDEQGKRTYTWKDRFGEAHVARIRKSTGPNKFTSQMLLRPVSITDGVLNVDNLGRYDAELEYREALGRAVLTLDGVKLVSATCWWDPAFARPAGEGDGRSRGATAAWSPRSSPGRTSASTCTGCCIWPSIPRRRRRRPTSNAGRSPASWPTTICRRSTSRSTALAVSCPDCCANGCATIGWPPGWSSRTVARPRRSASSRPSTPCWLTAACWPIGRSGKRRLSAKCATGVLTAGIAGPTTGWTRWPAAWEPSPTASTAVSPRPSAAPTGAVRGR